MESESLTETERKSKCMSIVHKGFGQIYKVTVFFSRTPKGEYNKR